MTSDELKALEPHQTLDLCGDRLTVRALGFVESMRFQGAAEPIIQGLADGKTSPSELDMLISENYRVVAEMMAASVDRPVSWVESLKQEDGYRLFNAFWGVNGSFFISRVRRRKAAGMLAEALTRSHGEESTPP